MSSLVFLTKLHACMHGRSCVSKLEVFFLTHEAVLSLPRNRPSLIFLLKSPTKWDIYLGGDKRRGGSSGR